MTEVHLIVDAKTLRSGNMGPATGNVWLALGDSAFPLEGWNDFIVVVLESWVSAALRLLRGLSKCELVHFMEGPYALEMAVLAPGMIRLRAIKHGHDEVTCVDAKAIPLIESVLAGSESVLNACREQNCWSTDAEKLSVNLPALRREAVRLKN